ncbi:MAG: restriction endonuclease [Propionicimonas sp.]
MGIPDFQTAMRPVLAALADGEVHRTRAVKDKIADEFGLTDGERSELLPSGRQRVIDNRVGWAITYLSQAGLVDKPARGQVRINDIGRRALTDFPDRIDMKVLERYPSYLEFRERTRKARDDLATPVALEMADEPVSPQDLASRALQLNNAVVEDELLTRALALEPYGFESLVMRLLEAMGYGGAGSVVRTSQTGDGGIDGIISQDPLGLDRIYVQAKRYATDATVARPAIQAFVGALMGAQGDRGVFITTSSFSSGARAEADRVNARIELIDGTRLAKLMVRYRVGVQPQTTITLYDVDEDFFEQL